MLKYCCRIVTIERETFQEFPRLERAFFTATSGIYKALVTSTTNLKEKNEPYIVKIGTELAEASAYSVRKMKSGDKEKILARAPLEMGQ